MNCIVCGCERITNEMGKCPDCHFPLIKKAGAGDDLAYQNMIAELAQKHINEYKSKTSVGLTVYSYKRNKNDLELNEAKERILINNFEKTKEGEIYWCDTKYARLERDEPITLTITVHGLNSVHTHKVQIKIPPIKDLWQVGIKPEEKLNFRIMIGRPDNYTGSGLISMVRE